MNKKILILCVLVLCLPLCFAQEYKLGIIKECKNITISINASLPIDDGEYYLKNMTEQNDNYWVSDCSGGYQPVLVAHNNALNNYSYEIKYYSEEEEPNTGGGSGGGGGGGGSDTTKIYFKVQQEDETGKVLDSWQGFQEVKKDNTSLENNTKKDNNNSKSINNIEEDVKIETVEVSDIEPESKWVEYKLVLICFGSILLILFCIAIISYVRGGGVDNEK